MKILGPAQAVEKTSFGTVWASDGRNRGISVRKSKLRPN